MLYSGKLSFSACLAENPAGSRPAGSSARNARRMTSHEPSEVTSCHGQLQILPPPPYLPRPFSEPLEIGAEPDGGDARRARHFRPPRSLAHGRDPGHRNLLNFA